MVGVFVVLGMGSSAWGQTVADCRSKATGDWTTSGTWEFYNGSSWVALGTTLSTDINAFTTDPGWTNVQIGSGINWIWGSSSGNGNGGMSYTNPINTVSNGTWYYKPITLTAGVTYSLTFDYKTSNVTASNSRIVVDLSANIPTSSITWTGATELYNALQATSGAWVNNTGTASFTAITTGTHYLGFRNAFADAAAAITSSVDNITITGTCIIPSYTSGAIAVQSPNTVTVSSDLTVDQLTINSGGTLLLSAGTLSINDGADANDFIIKGTYKRTATLTTIAGSGVVYCDNGGIYEHALNAGIIPSITWITGSTLKFTAVAGTMPTATGTYQNVVWNCTSQSGALGLEDNLNSISGNFTIQSTNGQVLYLGNLGATPRTMSIGGNLNMEGGVFAIRASTFNSSLHTINVAGNYDQTGGNFQLSRTTAGTNIPLLNVAGDFTCSGGTLDNNAGANTLSTINFTKNGTQLFTLGGTIANGIEFNVKSGSVLEFATATTVLSNASVNCKFTVESGGGLIIKHAQGVSTTAGTGCINIGAPTAANYILSTAGNYTFNGSAPQVTGNKFPVTVNNLTVSNSSGATLTSALTVNGTLNLSSGIITSGTSNLLTIGSSGTISNASTSSYIDGKLVRVITGTSATAFPVGKGGFYRPVTFTYTAAPTSKTVTIEQFESGSPMSLASVSTARFGGRYWNITQSATGIGYTVGLNNSGLTPTGSAVILKREGTDNPTANAASFSSPTYTNSTGFSTTNTSNDVQLGENTIPLTVSSAAATSKMYDKANTAAVTGTLSGIVSPDAVTLNGTGTFASVNVANGIGVTSTSTLAGANAGAYSLTQPTGLTANITARPLTITGATNTKTFDGNISSATNPTVTSGVVQSGDVAAFTQAYDNAAVGTSKVMTPSGVVSDGNSGNNYSYSFVPSSNGIINAATSTQWDGSESAVWNNADNWTPPVAPAAGISATVVSSGTAPIISSTGNVCEGLTIASGILTIASTGDLTVAGTLSNAVNASALVIQSDATGTGSLIHATSGVPATVNRYFTGAAESWHQLSAPAAQGISGGFTPTGTYPDGSGYDFFAWDEPTGNWINRKNLSTSDPLGTAPYFDIVNAGLNFQACRGYLVSYQATNPTKVFQGNLNTGSASYSLSKTGSATYSAYNLVGNPYCSAIDWKAANGWNRTNLTGDLTIVGYDLSIWNEAAGNYGSFNSLTIGNGSNGATQYIPVGQGFMVKASSAGTFEMDSRVRVHNTQSFLKSADAIANILRLKVTGDVNSYSDEVVVEFGHPASNGGAEKMFSMYETAPSLYTVKPTGNYSIDFRGEAGATTIPVSFKAGSDGTYTFTAGQLETFASWSAITLEDLKAAKTQNLMQNPVYTFTAAKGDAEARFLLHFGGAFGVNDQEKGELISVHALGNSILITSKSGNVLTGDVSVYNMIGQQLASQKLNRNSVTKLSLNAPTGYYLVKVVTGDQAVSAKVFINKQ